MITIVPDMPESVQSIATVPLMADQVMSARSSSSSRRCRQSGSFVTQSLTAANVLKHVGIMGPIGASPSCQSIKFNHQWHVQCAYRTMKQYKMQWHTITYVYTVHLLRLSIAKFGKNMQKWHGLSKLNFVMNRLKLTSVGWEISFCG